MTEHEKRIREALEAGPTEGPFQVVRGGTYCWDIKTTDSYDVATTHGYVRNQVDSLPTANFIAACNPAAIRALLADLDAARAALSEAKAGGWQPIETAPKDGTRFIAWRKYSTLPLIARYWKDFGWFEDEDGLHLHNLTHWQPLPAPPAQRGEG